VLGLHGVEQPHQGAERLRQIQKPQRVARGGGVHDDASMAAGVGHHQFRELERRKDLVGAR
jgi:hypothetical protein